MVPPSGLTKASRAAELPLDGQEYAPRLNSSFDQSTTVISRGAIAGRSGKSRSSDFSASRLISRLVEPASRSAARPAAQPTRTVAAVPTGSNVHHTRIGESVRAYRNPSENRLARTRTFTTLPVTSVWIARRFREDRSGVN